MSYHSVSSLFNSNVFLFYKKTVTVGGNTSDISMHEKPRNCDSRTISDIEGTAYTTPITASWVVAFFTLIGPSTSFRLSVPSRNKRPNAMGASKPSPNLWLLWPQTWAKLCGSWVTDIGDIVSAVLAAFVAVDNDTLIQMRRLVVVFKHWFLKLKSGPTGPGFETEDWSRNWNLISCYSGCICRKQLTLFCLCQYFPANPSPFLTNSFPALDIQWRKKLHALGLQYFWRHSLLSGWTMWASPYPACGIITSCPVTSSYPGHCGQAPATHWGLDSPASAMTHCLPMTTALLRHVIWTVNCNNYTGKCKF